MKTMDYPEFQPKDNQVVISFTKVGLPFGWLGNMSPDPVSYEGKVWRTSEALFQALRFPEDHEVRELIRAQKSPMAAKMVAKKQKAARFVEPQSADDVKLMQHVLRIKLQQNLECPVFARNWHDLVEKDNLLIIEDSSRRKNTSGLFWGAALIDPEGQRWCGFNRLGELWMELLEEYRLTRGAIDVS